MSTEKKESAVKHPLLAFTPINSFESFEEWLKKWNGTNYLSDKLGLLHGIELHQNSQYVSFLLEIANGYASRSGFTLREDWSEQCSKDRHAIAEKAFTVLCLKFFKSGEKYYNPPLWWWMLENAQLFDKVLWFLGPNLKNCCFMDRDDNPTHPQQVFNEFLIAFAKLGWGGYRSMANNFGRGCCSEDVEKRLITARPQFIDILDQISMLSWLNHHERDLDKASLKKLTELALESNYHFPPNKVNMSGEYRNPISLEEAVLGGSVAAEIVLLNKIRQQECKRIRASYDLSAQARDTETRKRQLAEIEKQKKALELKADELINPQ